MKKLYITVLSLIAVCAQGDPPDPNYTPPNVEAYLNPTRPPEEILQDTYPQGVGPPSGAPIRTTIGEAQSAAQAQAIYWLTLLDQKRYPASYNHAGEIFRAVISSKIWKAAMDQIRSPNGNVRSRKVTGTKKLNNLGGLKGNYINIVFKTEFSKGGSMTESVTLSSEGGQWKVVSYQIL